MDKKCNGRESESQTLDDVEIFLLLDVIESPFLSSNSCLSLWRRADVAPRGESMIRIRRSDRAVPRLLLIALLIQGCLPDPRDLASFRALSLACRIRLDLPACSDQGGTADDLCLCSPSSLGREANVPSEERIRGDAAWPGFCVSPNARSCRHFRSARTPMKRVGDLVDQHNRLDC
jgi:hypothetical protein